MSVVRGDNVSVFIYDNGGWRPYFCARTASLTTNTSFIETSVTGSGKDATYIPEKNSFTGTLDGVTALNMGNGLTLPDLRQRQLAQVKLLMNFERTDTAGNTYIDQAYFYIQSITDTGAFNDIATFSISLQGTGPITQSFTPTNLALSSVRRQDYTATSNQTTFGGAVLINKDILAVDVDGIGYADIITSGTPVDKQALYDITTGFITILQPQPAGVKIYILYQDI